MSILEKYGKIGAPVLAAASLSAGLSSCDFDDPNKKADEEFGKTQTTETIIDTVQYVRDVLESPESKREEEKESLLLLQDFISKNLETADDIPHQLNFLQTESERLNFQEGIAKAFYLRGHYERFVCQDYTQAIENYQESLAIYENLSSFENEKVLLHISLGLSWERSGKLVAALESFEAGLDLCEYDDTVLQNYMSYLYSNLADIYTRLQKWEKAEEFYKKGLTHFQKKIIDAENEKNIEKKEYFQISLYKTQNNIGELYIQQASLTQDPEKQDDLYVQAEKFLGEAYRGFSQLADEKGLGNVYTNLGALSYNKKEFEEALQYLQKALDARVIEGDERSISQAVFNMGDIHRKLNNIDIADSLVHKAIIQSEKINAQTDLYEMYSVMSDLKAQQKQWEEAYMFDKKFESLNDSLSVVRQQERVANQESKKELEQKEQEIREKTNLTLVGGMVSALFILLSIQLYRKNKDNKRKNKKLAESQEELKKHETELIEKNEELKKSQKTLEIKNVELEEAQDMLRRFSDQLQDTVDRQTYEIQEKNKALEEVNKELQDRDKWKSEILNLVSHNLATPLTHLLGELQLLEHSIKTGIIGSDDTFPQFRKYLEDIEATLESGYNILEDLDGFSNEEILHIIASFGKNISNLKQSFDREGGAFQKGIKEWFDDASESLVGALKGARKLQERFDLMKEAVAIQNGNIHFQKQPADFMRFHYALSSFIDAAQSDNVSVQYDYIQDEDLCVVVDETFLGKICSILMKNAEESIAHIQQNVDPKRRGSLLIRTRIEDEMVHIDFVDNGRGFTDKALQNLGKFAQTGDDIKNLHMGMGLGLFMVRSIMEKHDGALSAQNNNHNDPSQGATVTLSFPLFMGNIDEFFEE